MSQQKQHGGAFKGTGAASRKNSGHTGKWTGNAKYVTYCPECKQEVDPRATSHVTVSAKTKRATCKNGHEWAVR